MNKVLAAYVFNFVLTLILIVLRAENVIQCSIVICLLPVLLISTFLGIISVIICKALLKGDKTNGN